jgi:hypothetical protein
MSITEYDMLSITDLSVDGSVKDLSGIVFARNLKSFWIHYGNPSRTIRGLSELYQLPNLKELTIMNEMNISFIKNMPNLTHLTIMKGLFSSSEIDAINSLQSLEFINFWGDNDLAFLTRNQAIKKIDISAMTMYSNVNLSALLKLENLEELIISYDVFTEKDQAIIDQLKAKGVRVIRY